MQDSFAHDDLVEIDREKPPTKPDTPPASVPAATTEPLVNPFAIFRQRNASRLVDWAFWEADMPAPPVPLRPISTVSLPAKPATPVAKLAPPADAKRSDLEDEIPF